MCSISPNSLLQPFSQSQYYNKSIELTETELEAKVKLELSGQQRYILRLKESFIVLYPGCGGSSEHLASLNLDFNLKMSRIYSETQTFSRPQSHLQGIKLENQKAQSVSFYFKSPNQIFLWIKKLSLYVNQTQFQKLYKPIRKLGKGASAAVYEVRRLEDGKKFAAKVFSKNKVSEGLQLFQNLKKQVEILRIISYEGIMKFEGVFQNEETYFLVMELIKGMNIYEFLLVQKRKLQIEEIRTIIRNIMKNLTSLEQLDIIHRDLKLQNIIIDSNTLNTTIIDYGLAVFSIEEDYIYYNCGTPGYLSPELINNKKGKITTKSDVFSAGIIFHVLLTGKYLFAAPNVKQIWAKNKKMEFELSELKKLQLDVDATSLLQNMLAVIPEERFSASECLNHQFLREEHSDEDFKVNTPTTVADKQQIYQF